MSPDPEQADNGRTRLAYDLLEAEGMSASDVSSVARAAAAVLGLLFDRLRRLIGGGGYEAILGRAAVIAARSHPGVDRLPIPAARAPTDDELALALAEAREGETVTVARTLIAEFLSYLARLVGWKLVLVLLRDAWPEVVEGYDATTLDDIGEPRAVKQGS